MNSTTTYRTRLPSSAQRNHPIQIVQRKMLSPQNKESPIRQAVRDMCASYQLKASFVEDEETLATFSEVPGIIAVKCLLELDGAPLGVGHGSAILTRINRSVERTSLVCLNAAFMSAANSACKSLDSLRLGPEATPLASGGAYRTNDDGLSNLITDKQKSYLLGLIQSSVLDEDERERRVAQIEELTRSEASEMIKSFMK